MKWHISHITNTRNILESRCEYRSLQKNNRFFWLPISTFLKKMPRTITMSFGMITLPTDGQTVRQTGAKTQRLKRLVISEAAVTSCLAVRRLSPAAVSTSATLRSSAAALRRRAAASASAAHFKRHCTIALLSPPHTYKFKWNKIKSNTCAM